MLKKIAKETGGRDGWGELEEEIGAEERGWEGMKRRVKKSGVKDMRLKRFLFYQWYLLKMKKKEFEMIYDLVKARDKTLQRRELRPTKLLCFPFDLRKVVHHARIRNGMKRHGTMTDENLTQTRNYTTNAP